MVVVEAATVEDAGTVADRWVELAASQRAFGSHLLAEENRETVREAFVRQSVADRLLVAREADSIVGFVGFATESGAYEQDVDRGVVRNIYVDPDRRGEGIGSELLGAAESALAEAGVDTVVLDVLADNDAARRFYRRHGYRPHRVELEKRPESDTLTKE
ncbi:GNAT family N-acetyltransferase [Halorussus marinus]|uniref:GNAT family N-acetyltransferase n=1 Tax=Halorussus marinus TaxID=2505976 RepID=UPI00106EA807|nr:GNAT family N-acetyltransferase [Halorussus marinus]